MPTPKFICGAECGIAAVGTVSAGLEHWSSVSGTAPTVVTSGPSPMRSTRCFRHNATTNNSYMDHTFASAIGSPATLVSRFYVYFASLPSGDAQIGGGSASRIGGATFKASDSKIYAGDYNVPGFGASGVSVTTGVWYRIDVKHVHDATMTVDVQVDGVACGQYSVAASSSSCTGVRSGVLGLVTHDVYIDDLIASGTSGDYPIGAGTVAGLYPTSDGSHNYNLASDFLRDGSTNLGLAATDAYTELQNPLSTTIGTFLTAAAEATSEYVRCRFADLPANALTVNGVGVVSTNHAASATTCAHDLLIVDDSATSGTTVASEVNHLGGWAAGVFTAGVDLSETTITVPYSIAATGATTGAWTVANVNDLAAIFGGTDVNPDAHHDGVCLEVDITTAPPAVMRLDYFPQLLAH